MYKITLNVFITFIFITNLAIGQTDTLNKYNSKKKKNGYWKVFLNKNANVIKDSTKSYFYGYELWDNGEKVFFFAHYPKISIYKGPAIIKGHPIPISGTFKWFDQKNRPSLESKYENGYCVHEKAYSRKNKTDTTSYVSEDIDFTIKYNNIPGTAFCQIFLSDNTILRYWFRKGEKGWRLYLIN